MARRRSNFDPLAISTAPHWLVVRDKHSQVVEHHLLPAASDLRGAFAKALAAHVDSGWQLETFSSNLGSAYCSQRSERRSITIESEDPSRPIGSPHRRTPGL